MKAYNPLANDDVEPAGATAEGKTIWRILRNNEAAVAYLEGHNYTHALYTCKDGQCRSGWVHDGYKLESRLGMDRHVKDL